MFDIANPTVIRELTQIANKDREGILRPERVVAAAQPKESILHKYFEWDDTEAAVEYRLHQARTLIRCTVRYVKLNGDRRPVRVFTSLREDRFDSGGYRLMVNVLSSKTLRRQMLEDALAELQQFERKYNDLRELSEVFAASKKIRQQLLLAWGKAAA